MKSSKMFRGYGFIENGIYPDDFFSYPELLYIDNFSHMASVGLSGDIYENEVNYKYNELKLISSDEPYTEWCFCPCTHRRSEVNVCYQLYRLPKKLSIEVKAISGKISDAILSVSTLGWKRVSELTSDRFLIPAEKSRVNGVITFDFEKFFSDKKITLPITDFAISVDSLADTEYRLELRGIYAEFNIMPQESLGFSLPNEINGGNEYEITFETGIKPQQVLDFEFRRGKYVFYRERFFAEDIKEGKQTYVRNLPSWLAGESYTVTASADGVRVGKECTVKINQNEIRGFPEVERRKYNGRMSVFVDGEPFPWVGYASYDYVPGSVNDFGNSGINLFCIPVACGQHIHAHVADPTILGVNRYDYGQIDERVGFSLQSNPDAKIMLRVNLLLPRAWMEAHPGCEPLVYRDGKLLKWAETSGVQDISLMCEDWLKDQTEELEKLLAYCESRPWGNRVIGIMVSGEVTEEWFAWAANSQGVYYGDYSTHGIAAFKKWLEDNSCNADTSLSPYAVPLPSQRKFPGVRFKPNTGEGRLAAAYSEFLNDFTAGIICHFASAVKRASHGRLLAGSLYGYVIQLAGDDRQSTAGHMGLQKYLECDDIDYICGIPWLNYRDPVNGFDTFVSAAESVYAHGKLVVNENDSFSVFHPFIWHKHYPGEKPGDKTGGAGLMHRSTFAYDFVRNNPRQYFSLMATWHYDPDMQKVLSELAGIEKEHIASDIDHTGCEEIAFMVDDHSYAWAEETSGYTLETVSKVLHATGRTGAPVGTWILSDIDKLPDRIKFVIVTNALCPTKETLRKLQNAIDAGGRTFLIIGELGVYDPESGEKTDKALPVIPDSYRFSAYDSPNAEMHVVETSTHSKVIFSSVPVTSSEQLRDLFVEAGVHFYVPVGNYCHAANEVLSVTAGRTGKLGIKMRYDTISQDLYSGERNEGAEQEWNFEEGQTRLFVLRKKDSGASV